MLRTFVVAAALLAAQTGHACDCFPPKLRAEMAQRNLKSATFAVYARVVAVASGGEVTLRVIESFKGPPKNSEVRIPSNSEYCHVVRFSVGEEALVTAFDGRVSACDKYTSPEPFVLEAYRKAAQK